MTQIVVKFYELFLKHRALGWSIVALITVGLVYLVCSLQYKEDISDFLPLDSQNQTAMAVYQDVSGANNIYAILSVTPSDGSGDSDSADLLIEAVDKFRTSVENSDTLSLIRRIVSEIDVESNSAVTDFVYENMPLFLTDCDYRRIDSLLVDGDYARLRLQEDKELLMFPSSSMMAENLRKDPLGLFAPVMDRLIGSSMSAIPFETYDGYMVSANHNEAFVIIKSNFGANESEGNRKLVALLNSAAAETQTDFPEVEVTVIGGPVIAVGNADRIKTDSLIAALIAGVLILALLVYVFKNLRNISLIAITVGWGWIFALGCIAFCYSSVSIIVLGISSIIIGIAVNYPLHLIEHLQHRTDRKDALREIVAPLVIGNITTVGAFLALLPLNAAALHDLGLFSSLLLVGTILFVLFLLPQLVGGVRKSDENVSSGNAPRLISKLSSIDPRGNRFTVVAILALTLFFGWFGMHTEFDTDLRNINFMTDSQRSQLKYFEELTSSGSDTTATVYVVSNGNSWEEAVRDYAEIAQTVDSLSVTIEIAQGNNAASFILPREVQDRRINRWQRFRERYEEYLQNVIRQESANAGFSPEAFNDFFAMMDGEYESHDFEYFSPLTSTLFSSAFSENGSGNYRMVNTLQVPAESADMVKSKLCSHSEFGGAIFDVASMNSSVARSLTDDFNYIGFVCGAIVFLFLWISMGRLELALISFLPMALGWIWILGIMGILGIKFNIVNIILATFIFGQGDDYTIFITEGLTYEFTYRKKMLASFKNGIVVSALIMFIGIGMLVFAQHPALRSLGEVTIIGMISVVFMAYTIPPMLFRWLTEKNGKLRITPLTIKGFFSKKSNTVPSGQISLSQVCKLVRGRYYYKGITIERTVGKRLKEIENNPTIIEQYKGLQKIYLELHNGYGELALVLSLLYPASTVSVICETHVQADILMGCTHDFVGNILVNTRG